MKIWTQEEEARHLKARFANVNRAEFARQHGIKGGQASIYQHINALRPISLDAAKAYARGFGVPLEEISPRLAKEVAEASAYAGPAAGANPAPELEAWPFSVPFTDYQALSQKDKSVLDQTVSRFVAGCLAKREQPQAEQTFEMSHHRSDTEQQTVRRRRSK